MIQWFKCLFGKHKYAPFGYFSEENATSDTIEVSSVKCEACNKIESNPTRISIYDLKPPYGKITDPKKSNKT